MHLPSWLRLGAVFLLLACSTGQAGAYHNGSSSLPLHSKSFSKLSSRLGALAGSVSLQKESLADQSQALSLPDRGPGSLMRTSANQLMLYVRMNAITQTGLEALAAAGARILHVSQGYGLVTILLNPDRLLKVTAVPEVAGVWEVLTPQAGTADLASVDKANTCSQPQGAFVTEGDAQLKADQARSAYQLDGSGVKVGVLSDSFNQTNSPDVTIHAAQDILSGDLPGAQNPCSFHAPVFEYAQSVNIKTDEGRAMLQIVHDLAPAANLSFATALNGMPAYADNIRALRSDGADILVDDIFYYEEPFFQEGPINQAITDVVRSGGLYFTLAGNNNTINLNGQDLSSYEAPAYRPIPCPSADELVFSGDCHNFDAGSATVPGSSIRLAPNGSIQLDFQWAEPWFGVATDLDIYLLDDSAKIVAYSNDDNRQITQTPFEFLSFTNHSGVEKTYQIVINRTAGTANPRLKFIFLQGTHNVTAFQPASPGGPDIVGPTLFGHSASFDGISVAAVPFSDSANPEPYSSYGPAVMYFGPVADNTPAAGIPPQSINQPDIAASDGGCTTFFGVYFASPLPGCFRFYGTSAAAPHAAGAAALLKQRANLLHIPLSNLMVKSILGTTARVVSAPNPASAGSGLVDVLAAAAKLGSFDPLYLPVIQK